MLPFKRSQLYVLFLSILCAFFSYQLSAQAEVDFGLSGRDYAYIRKMIFQHECSGNTKNFIAWNEGEDFPSLGMGHFIWFTKSGPQPPYKELFPELLVYLEKNGKELPPWIKQLPDRKAPWDTREEFLRDQESPRMYSLRSLMTGTVRLQTSFIADRIKKLLPRIIRHAPPARRNEIRHQFISLIKSKEGLYALIDYTHFKGDGLHETERYGGEGWGLLQVLEEMKIPESGGSPIREFVCAAKEVLRRRVRNAPVKRNEQRWLKGWENRVESYQSHTA